MANSLTFVPSAYKANKVYSVIPANGDGDFDFTRASSATRVNENGLIETVGSNVPRIDYSDGGCPSLLLEPQRTNLITYSDDFTQWTINGTLTPNVAISLDGTQNASLLEANPIKGRLNINATLLADTDYIVSMYVKANDITTNVKFRVYESSSLAFIKTEIISNELILGEWVRVEMTFTTILGGICQIRLLEDLNLGTSAYVWGAQLEQGSYSTSYIPTNGSISTRNIETCNNAGNVNTFNSSEGVLFVEVTALADGGVNRYISLSNGSSNNRIQILYESNANRLTVNGVNGGVAISNIQSLSFTQTENHKIAVMYSFAGVKVFVDGVEIGSNTDNASFSTGALTNLDLTLWNNTSLPFFGKVKQLQYFDTALTDQELQELTTL